MVKVNINTFGGVGKEVGWSSKELKLEQAKVTVDDVLRSVKLGDGGSLFDMVANGGGTKDGYTILVNGHSLWTPKDLQMELTDKDLVTVMDILYPIGGG